MHTLCLSEERNHQDCRGDLGYHFTVERRMLSRSTRGQLTGSVRADRRVSLEQEIEASTVLT